MNSLDKVLENYYRKLDVLKKHPIRNSFSIKNMRLRIQALEEGARDVLTTSILQDRGRSEVVDKNNFRTYASKVNGAYDMYENKCDYGGEVFAPVADMRVAFIGGEGLSVSCSDKAKEDFILGFIEYNKFNDTDLLDVVRLGEFEGKILFVLSASNDKQVKARLFSWYNNRYTVKRDSSDYRIIQSITYKRNDKDEEIDLKKAVYIKIGSCNYLSEDTPTKLNKTLTQCENASRALYDLRKNTHLFAKVMPAFETLDIASAKAINNDLANKSFEIGDGYAGTAKFKLLEPSGAATEALIKDLLVNLRFVGSNTGVPIHWLNWPELMSNRATAENLLEVVSAATKTERLAIEGGFKELFQKACAIAADKFGSNEVLGDTSGGDIQVKLPLISLAALKQLTEVWLELWREGHISDFTFRNMIPGIDPVKEKKMIDEEKKEREKNDPFINKTLDNSLKNMQNKDNGYEEEE